MNDITDKQLREFRRNNRKPANLSFLFLIVTYMPFYLMVRNVPKFIKLFEKSGDELPGLTFLIVSLSKFTTSHFSAVLLILTLINLVAMFYFWTSLRKKMGDKNKLYFIYLGSLCVTLCVFLGLVILAMALPVLRMGNSF